MVNRRGFQTLIRTLEPKYTIPSRTTFSREIIPRLYESEKERIQKILNHDIEEGNVNYYF